MNMNTRKRAHGVWVAVLAGGVGLATYSGAGCAATVGEYKHALAGIKPLSDPQLAVMRGKYLPPDRNGVLYFGVQMVSRWQTPTGEMSASLALGINRASGQPVMTIEPTVTIVGSPSQPGGGDYRVTGGNPQGSHGVRQQIQVAGNNNLATNGLNVSIQHYDPSSSGGGAGPSTRRLSQNGAEVAAGTMGNGQAGVTIRLGGATVRQVIGGGSNALQMIQLTGNQQQVQNQMNLIVGTRRPSGLSSVNLLQQAGMAFSMTRGLR